MVASGRHGLCLCVLLLLGCQAGVVWAEENGTELIDRAWARAMLEGNLDGIMNCYADDATAWFPGSADLYGSKAIRDSYAHLLADNKVKGVDFTDMHYVGGVGKRSAGWGLFSITLLPKAGGDPVVLKGRFTEVAEKRDGRWVYIVDHASAEPPPPAATVTQ